MFSSITIGIFRRWQAKNKIVALLIQSRGRHTEAAVLRDDSDSAYQITLEASGFYFRPTLSILEYLPDSKRVIKQDSIISTVLSLRSDLNRALDIVFSWMKENRATRLPQDQEMILVRAMFERGRKKDHANDAI